MKSILITFICSVFLSGCGIAYYKPPEANEPKAKISFDIGFGGSLFLFTNGEDCSGFSKIPPESDPVLNGKAPLAIRANKEIAFHAGFETYGPPMNTSCGVAISFVPQANKEYKLSLSSTMDGCEVGIQRLSSKGKYEPEPTAVRRNYVRAFIDSGSFCKPKQ